MKKLLIVVATCVLLFSAAGCGNIEPTEPATATARPLSMRSELLQEIQGEFNAIEDEFNMLEDDDARKDALKEKMLENLTEQAAVMNGNDVEERLDDALATVGEYLKLAEEYSNAGDEEKAHELIETVNMIMYGNKDGVKTW